MRLKSAALFAVGFLLVSFWLHGGARCQSSLAAPLSLAPPPSVTDRGSPPAATCYWGGLHLWCSEPAGPGVIRVPGGKPVALILASLGFAVTLLTIVLSLIPGADEPNKILAVVKVVRSTGLVLSVGVLLYWCGKRNANRAAAFSNTAMRTGPPSR